MNLTPEKAEEMKRILVDRLESLQQSGVAQLPRKKSRTVVEVVATTAVNPEPTSETAAVLKPPILTVEAMKGTRKKLASLLADDGESKEKLDAEGRDLDKVPTLDVLQQIVAGCTRCGELAQTRNQTVFGVGDPAARLCFLGEAPGADEDRLGEPFVGRAGQLLTKIIEACKLKREDVYILNMIKCRPPGNRNPLPTELANCRGYLDRQLDLIRPEFICCCGAVASQNLLNTTVSIGKLRGKIHEYRGIKVVCTYHPAFLLRSPSFKKETWEDMKFLMREMGVELG